MPKSKYPNSIDSSVELPQVRDNITEITSEVINSLRSAIFQIERTLGVNPQGASGNTVASRINNSLDENGNILDSALDKLNILTGPVLNSDISDVASISERKLNLDFSTKVLQSQISSLSNRISNLINSIDELSSNLAIHTTLDARSRHNAVSIDVKRSEITSSDVALNSLDSQNLQNFAEGLFNSHIYFSGENVSSLNRSHTAKQIFFDNDSISSIVNSSNLQEAVEDIANIQAVGIRDSILNISSNGRIRKGTVVDGYMSGSYNRELISDETVTFNLDQSSVNTLFTLASPLLLSEEIYEFDILSLSGSDFEDDNRDYIVSKVNKNTDDEIISIEVFGGPLNETLETLKISVRKNSYQSYNTNGLNSSVRFRSSYSNTPDVILASPDSATIISYKVNPNSITSSENSFDITIDGNSPVTIETFDSTLSEQSLDSIVAKINKQCSDLHLNFHSYKILTNHGYELALSHIVPNFSNDVKNRSLKIASGSINDGTEQLGLSDLLEIDYFGTTGNSFMINGLVTDHFGMIKTFDNSQVQITSSTLTLYKYSGTFYEEGIRVGDTVVIAGSTSPGDDGSYRIKSINDEVLTLDLDSESFDGELDEDSLVIVIRNSISIEDMEFEKSVSLNGTILFDVFIDEDKDIFYKKRMEISGTIKSSDFYAVVSDVSKNFITSNQQATITVNKNGTAYLTDPNSQAGDSVFVGADGTYKLYSGDNLSYVVLRVRAQSNPSSRIQATLYGFDEVSQSHYHVSRGSFSTSLGYILGENSFPGIPSLIDKRHSGTVDETIIGETVLEKYIQGPRNELRLNGVISGLAISNPQYFNDGGDIYQTVDIEPGICFVSGIRYSIPGYSGFRYNSSGEFYISIDNRGNIVTNSGKTNPDIVSDGYEETISPFGYKNNCLIGLSYADSLDSYVKDYRLMIDNLDAKNLDKIIVSNSLDFGHFTDLKSAVDFSRDFGKIYPKLRSPNIFILPGVFEISEPILIDFDCSIIGSGYSTVLKKTETLAEGIETYNDRPDGSSSLFIIGGGVNSNSDKIINGVTFKNFTYETSSSLANVGSVFFLAQEVSVSNSQNALFSFENINFLGTKSINYGGGTDSDNLGEYALIIGQQTGSTYFPVANIEMGNVRFSNCKLDSFGLETGAIYIIDSSGGSYSNILVTGNIATNMSPNLGTTDFVLLEDSATIRNTTYNNVVETGNIIDY